MTSALLSKVSMLLLMYQAVLFIAYLGPFDNHKHTEVIIYTYNIPRRVIYTAKLRLEGMLAGHTC